MSGHEFDQRQATLNGILTQAGIPVLRRTFTIEPFAADIKQFPVCAVWEDSAIPTESELDIIMDVINARLRVLNRHASDGIFVEQANTIVFIKGDDGLWRFRRRLWSDKDWSTVPKSLEDLASNL